MTSELGPESISVIYSKLNPGSQEPEPKPYILDPRSQGTRTHIISELDSISISELGLKL